jgi:hypothetical protein
MIHACPPAEAMGFNLTFISTYDAGESYTEQEHRDWLRQAGFVDIERANSLLPDNLSVMTARKSKTAAKNGPAKAHCDFWDTITFPWPHL